MSGDRGGHRLLIGKVVIWAHDIRHDRCACYVKDCLVGY